MVDDIVCDKIYKKGIILEHEIVFKRRIWEDTLFNHEYMFNARKISFIQDTLYFYRLNPNSASYKYSPQKLAAMIESNDDIIDFFKQNNFDNAFIREKLNSMLKGLIIRMEGFSRSQRREIFVNFNKYNGPFSQFILPSINLITKQNLLYLFYRIKTLGLITILKIYIKGIVKQLQNLKV